MKAICPGNPDHKIFITVAHQMNDWKVDQFGNFQEDLGCIQVTCPPQTGNIWSCAKCGSQAQVEG